MSTATTLAPHKPAALQSYEIVRNFQGAGDVVIFKRDLPAPRDELIIDAKGLKDKAAAFEATRPADAAMMHTAYAAYTSSLKK